ncbi:ABC transporter permease, partial [bacterium]|nr:ABC transporter permease [bacterium]
AALCPGFIDFAIASLILVAGIIYYGVAVPLSALWTVPLVLAGVAVLSLGLGMFLGSLNVRYRDVNNGISFLLQMWMFATPVVYPVSLISPQYRLLAGINPMVGYVEAFRSALFGHPLHADLLAISVGISAITLVAGTKYFVRVEKTFADIV